jgi:hypothetical protein
MGGIHPRMIRLEQCEACATIRVRYGRRSAFDYLVAEKLTTFADAANQHPDFARELPAFVAAVRELFTNGDLRAEFARLELETLERDRDREDAMLDCEAKDDDAFADPPAVVSERAARFEMIKELLLADQLGFS